jgi:heme/copper-type cytochrome/quinol oxidase subunit 3
VASVAIMTRDQEPCVVQLHPEQEEERLTSELGLVIFLASWAVLFAALFFGWGFFRVNATPAEVVPLPIAWPLVNTLLLVVSSLCFYWGVKALRAGRHARAFGLVLGTTAGGLVFLAIQLMVWTELWASGFTLRSGLFGNYFYVLTCFHALHVLVGVGLNLWVLPQVRRPYHPKRAVRTRLVALFWHFVDVVWVSMFLMVYLP